MKNNEAFERFAKGKPIPTNKNNTCVIYTRVSTKEQAEHNMSLDTQRRTCENYARKHGYCIMAYFGGTYESAKTDERIEFNNMLSFVQKSREVISFIIVYSVDRFSRSGANAIYIKEQLRQVGVSILSVSQPTDINSPSGNLQQNIQFIFSEYDNQLRREKCIAGMRDKLLRGEWFVKPPIGYDVITVNGVRSIVVNKTGDLIRKAFLWKFYEHLSQKEIYQRLYAMGVKINKGRMSCIFHNPFYCGIIVNKLLEGKVVQGKHEKLISKELFLAINKTFSSRRTYLAYCTNNEYLPLKNSIFCYKCNSKMTGYTVKGKDLYYYKCSTIGCSSNRSAIQLHSKFTELLRMVKVDTENYPALAKEFPRNFIEIEKIANKSCKIYQGNCTKLKNKMELLEERFVLGEIKEPAFNKYLKKLQEENEEAERQIEKAKAGLVPKRDVKEEAEKILLNLSGTWLNSPLNKKELIQSLIFPEGIYYNRAIDRLVIKKMAPGFYLANP